MSENNYYENEEMQTNPEVNEFNQTEEEPGDFPQTETESEETPLNEAISNEESQSLQTDIENAENGIDQADAELPDESESLLSQTETETEEDEATKTPARRTRARKKAAPSQSDESFAEATEAAVETDESKNPHSSDDDAPAGKVPAKRTRRKARTQPVVSIDERRSVETVDDKLKNDLLDLVESMKGKKILTETVQGIERSTENSNISYAVLYHGEFKIIIPADQFIEEPMDYRGLVPSDVMHYLITKRLGAEVDFVVKGVDPKSGIAAASRLEAMALKKREYYMGTDRDGNYQIYEGINCEARIVSVIRNGIFVDLFGIETYIPLKELSYQRWSDATQYLQPGQRVLVRITKVERTGKDNIKVEASIKQASENPYEKALRRYSIGSRYVGTVSLVDTNGVFVSLDGGIDCLCSYPKRGRPPRGSRVTVRIIGMNQDSNRIWGAITHMTLPR